MILQIAWRNIWRNKIRSGVVMVAIAVGMFAGLFSTAFYQGMINQRLRDGIETEISHIQMHAPEFREEQELDMFMHNALQIADTIEAIQGIKGVSPRIVLTGMIASAETGSGVRIAGILPQKEQQCTNLFTKIIDGEWFNGIKRNPIVIGEKLANKLKVRVRSKMVITIQNADGTITSAAFRVSGIFKTINTGFDESNVFAMYSDLSKLAELQQNAAHEIAIRISNSEDVDPLTHKLAAKYSNMEVLTWRELSPELGYLNDIGSQYMYIFIVIILFALAFGIINTMLMVVLERVKEIGMLMAIGMKKGRLFRMLVLETVLLSLAGGIFGIFLGVIATNHFGKTGINLSMYATGMEKFGYDTLVFPEIDAFIVVNIALLVVITGILSALYPAAKALKYNPADAIRIE